MERVPQYINVEDKVAGPFTWKQLGWFFAAGGILAVLWQFLDKTTFYIVGGFIVLLAAAFAFYKPQGVPLANFVGFAITYLFKPKQYIWQRMPEKHKKKVSQRPITSQRPAQRRLDLRDVEAITQTLDTHGEVRSERIAELLQKRKQK